MYQLINDDFDISLRYSKLLYTLNDTEFKAIIDRDYNREGDAYNLRYRFGYENNYDIHIISSDLDIYPCSILEMMVSLALRIEEEYMEDLDKGLDVGRWFWQMISTLGLIDMTDDQYDPIYVNDILLRFLNREYSPNGSGGLFRGPIGQDFRKVEIWSQAMSFISEQLR